MGRRPELISSHKSAVLFGQVNIYFDSSTEGHDYTTSLNPKKANELDHELPIC